MSEDPKKGVTTGAMGVAKRLPAREEQLAQIYRRYVAMVQRRATRILGDSAQGEDVAHEVFMRFIQYFDAEERIEYSGALLYRMTTQAAIGRLRMAHRRATVTTSIEPEDREKRVIEDRLALKKVLALVNDTQAQLATYYYIDGMGQDEIAELMDIPRRQVGRHLEKFCERARKLLQPDGPTDDGTNNDADEADEEDDKGTRDGYQKIPNS